MGYSADISGEIQIVPTITRVEFANSPHYRAVRDWAYGNDLCFEVVETTTATNEGVLTKRQAVAIVCGGDERRGNDILEELEAIAKAHGQGDQGRMFVGRLDVRWPDIESSERRYKIVDGHAVEYAPSVLWPNASE
jgi:hypothetical protein